MFRFMQIVGKNRGATKIDAFFNHFHDAIIGLVNLKKNIKN